MAGPQPQPAILMNCIGSVEKFDPNSKKFDMWLGQFSEFCFLNNIPVEPVNQQGLVLAAHNRRRALFLANIGSRAFEVVSAACAPGFPREFSIGQLAEMIKEVFENPGHQESNRVIFHGRIQSQSETVFEYVSAIQLLAQNCNFGPAYNMIMKTRLISGIRHAETKVKLLPPALSYEESKRIAIDDDRIRIHMKSLAQQVNAVSVRGGHSSRGRGRGSQQSRGRGGSQQQSQSTGQYQQQQQSQNNNRGGQNNRGNHSNHRGNAHFNRGNQISGRGNSNFNTNSNGSYNNFRPCRRCSRCHDEKTCPAANWTCYKCQKTGHIASKCWTKVHNVQEDEQPTEEVNNLNWMVSNSQPFHTFENGV